MHTGTTCFLNFQQYITVYGNKYTKYHSIPQEKHEYKPSNTKSYITPLPTINGQTDSKLKNLKPAHTAIK